MMCFLRDYRVKVKGISEGSGGRSTSDCVLADYHIPVAPLGLKGVWFRFFYTPIAPLGL